MFATFMEVLDTTVVNVSLPHIAGSTVGDDRRSDVGADVVSRRQRDHPADDRLAGVSAFGRKRLLMLSVVGFTRRVVPVRPGAEPRRRS